MKRGNIKALLASSFFYNGLNTVQSVIFGFLTSLLFTKLFGLEILGQFTLVATYITIFFSIISSGILTGFKREAIRFSMTNDNIGNFLFLIFFLTLSLTILFTGIVLMFRDFIFESLNLQHIYLETLLLYLISHVLAFFPASLIMFTFESFQDIKPLFRISILSNCLKVIGLVSSVYFDLDITFAIVVYFLIPNVFIFFLSLTHIVNYYNFRIDWKGFSRSFRSCKNAIYYSLKLYPLMIAELVLGNIAIIMLSKSHSIENVGVFKILFNYYLLLKFIPEFFGRVINPTLTKLYFEKDLEKVLTYYNFTFKLSIIVCSMLSILFISFIEELLGIYGIYSAENIYVMALLLAANLVLTGSMIGGVFQAYNIPQFISLFVGLGSFTNFFLAIYLVPGYGILGASFSILGGTLISQIGLHYYIVERMSLRIEVKRFLFSIAIVLVLSTIILVVDTYNELLIIKVMIAVIMIIIYLIIIRFYGFFNSDELNQAVILFDKLDNKLMNALLRSVKIK